MCSMEYARNNVCCVTGCLKSVCCGNGVSIVNGVLTTVSSRCLDVNGVRSV